MKSYGYSIVEMAIALVVLGILLSSIVVPLKARFVIQERQQATELLESARQSVAGYSVANRTTGSYRLTDTYGDTHEISAGRPYLPCPDITGDGLENRIGMPPVATPVIFTVGVVVTGGSCMQNKGLLPWRTLGLSTSSDSWGRKFGYWVDPAFSSELFGFDKTYRANVSEIRMPYILGGDGIQTYGHRANRHIVGALICSQLINSADDGGCPPEDHQASVLAGVVLAINATMGVHNIPAYTSTLAVDPVQGVAEGAAFVIFSHGENGWGGINSANQCLLSPTNLREMANAFYASAHPLLSPPFSCAAINRDELTENIFVNAPPVYEGGESGDDIVMWGSPSVLFGMLLQAGAFPIPELGFSPRNIR